MTWPSVAEVVLPAADSLYWGPEETMDPLTAPLVVEAAVRDPVKAASGVTPRIVVHAPNTLPTTEFKSRRVVDRRRAVES